MRALLIAVVMMCGGGCVLYDPNQPVPVIDQGPEWVRIALYQSADFWQGHGVEIVPGTRGIPLRLGVTNVCCGYPSDTQALYVHTDGSIHLADDLAEHALMAKCSLAHEIGHAIGMAHVEGSGSLMSAITRYPSTGDCQWSALDDQELVRVGKH